MFQDASRAIVSGEVAVRQAQTRVARLSESTVPTLIKAVAFSRAERTLARLQGRGVYRCGSNLEIQTLEHELDLQRLYRVSKCKTDPTLEPEISTCRCFTKAHKEKFTKSLQLVSSCVQSAQSELSEMPLEELLAPLQTLLQTSLSSQVGGHPHTRALSACILVVSVLCAGLRQVDDVTVCLSWLAA